MVRIKLLDKIFKDNNSSGNNGARSSRQSASSSAATTSAKSSGSKGKSRLQSHDSHSMASNGSREDILSATSMLSTSTCSSATNDNSGLFSSILNENFICNCCLELFKNPVTLMCGHSFCQLCLADWFLISSNRRCPICRQEWFGVPKQNQALKATIRRLVKYDSNNYLTYNDKLTREEERKLKTFQQKCSANASSSQYSTTGGVAAFMGSAVGVTIGTGTPTNYNNAEQQHRNNNNIDGSLRALMNQRNVDSLYNFFAGLFVGVLLTTIAFMFVWVLFGVGGSSTTSSSSINNKYSPFMGSSVYLTSSQSHLMSSTPLTTHNGVALLRRKFSKPIEFWTCIDIQEWLFALGPWTNKIATTANALKIDGPKLLQLNETSLKEPPFDVKEDEFRKLLIDSIKVLKGCHFKAINFWEIKNNNRFEFVFFSLFFESFPRLTFLYYYLLDNDHHIQQLTRLSQMNIADLNENDYLYVESVKKSLLFKERIEMSLNTNNKLLSREISSFRTVSSFFKLPYMRFKNIFSLFFYESNKFLAVFLAIRCALLTLVDFVFLLDLIRSLIGFDTDRLKLIVKVSLFTYLKSISFICFLYIFWNLIPNLFIDAIFVYAFFLQIVFNLDAFVNNSKNFLASIGHYFIRPNH